MKGNVIPTFYFSYILVLIRTPFLQLYIDNGGHLFFLWGEEGGWDVVNVTDRLA